MLVNPYRDQLAIHQGTRILADGLGILGATIDDPSSPGRLWIVDSLYAPVRRALGGVRIKLIDEKGFVTFCNQRDAEVLLGLGAPGEECPWADEDYVEPGDRRWFGFCVDEVDLEDDLHAREMTLRSQQMGPLPPGMELTRRIHTSSGKDVEELLLLVRDYDANTGRCPDPSLETIDQRWASIEKAVVKWKRIL